MHFRPFFLNLILPLLWMAVANLHAAVFYVNSLSDAESPDGAAWTSAYPDLQPAVDAAAEAGGGEVWVRSGVYKPSGEGRSATFQMKPSVSVYGGFRGTETERTERNPRANRTVLSGDIGRPADDEDNCLHVVTAASASRLDGFIVSNGRANTEEASVGGGVMVPEETDRFVLAECTLEKNQAGIGGGLGIVSGTVSLTNCTFYGNAADYGGAVGAEGRARLSVSGSTLSANRAQHGGGLALRDRFDVVLTASHFLYNVAEQSGGALYSGPAAGQGAKLKIMESVFTENTAGANGGGLHLTGQVITEIAQTQFYDNQAKRKGGALYAEDGPKPQVADSLFSGNRALIGADDVEYVQSGDQVVVARPVPPPKPKRKMGESKVYDLQERPLPLKRLIGETDLTVVVLGELTDPAFIRGYRMIEAAARDYTPPRVTFMYVYHWLEHPENHGYLQPLHRFERARQTILAAERLETRVPWFYDAMDNETALMLANEDNDAVFIYSKNSIEQYAGPLSDEAAFRAALTKLAGAEETPTLMKDIPAPSMRPILRPVRTLTEPVIPDHAYDYQALRITALESPHPHYAKLRVEGEEALLESGDGSFYLGFHLDPIYAVEWYNMGKPLSYIIRTPRGSAVAPSRNEAPRITERPTDSEPREFLLDARKLRHTQPLPIEVSYTIQRPGSGQHLEITQQYLIHLDRDPCGGTALGRQVSVKQAAKRSAPSGPVSAADAFNAHLKRLDLDRDGRIARVEAAGALRTRFDQIDANRDDFIDREEFTAFQAK